MRPQPETAETPVTTSTRMDAIDAEADADAALKSLREFVISDTRGKEEAGVSIEQWPALDGYIEELCSYGVDRLTREPHDLTASSLRLKNDLEDVACNNYRALIESFECADAVRDGVARVKQRLDDLSDTLPTLAEATRQFSIKVAERQAIRQARLRSLSQLSAVSDLLEMPRLMRTLVASELYDEALELRDHALKLAALHPIDGSSFWLSDEEKAQQRAMTNKGDQKQENNDRGVIHGICDEIHVLTQQMILQLLVLLRNAVQLPTCLRVIGFLRRLRLFSELRLRMLFLHCRGEWMRAGIESSTATTDQAHLVNLSDNTRAMVFEIVTQYRAVFSDEDEDDSGLELHMTGENATQDADKTAMPNSSRSTFTIHSSAILFDWTASCVAEYLQRLCEGVDQLSDATALNTVLQQAMFCGQSLGRVGADFRASLPPMFERAVMRIFQSHLHAALRQFEMMVDDNRWAPVGSSALRNSNSTNPTSATASPLAPKTGDATDPASSTATISSASVNSYDPPHGVLDSPPLAVFLNGILVALNDLRLCAPASLASRVGAALQTCLIKAGDYMSAIGGPGGAFLKRSDRPHFVNMSISLRDLCVRHAARCLDHCMNRNGLVDIAAIDAAYAQAFGESLTSHSTIKLNGTDTNDDDDDTDLNTADELDTEANGVDDSEPNGKDKNMII